MYVCVLSHVCVCVCVCACVRMHACPRVCVNRERERERGAHTHTHLHFCYTECMKNGMKICFFNSKLNHIHKKKHLVWQVYVLLYCTFKFNK